MVALTLSVPSMLSGDAKDKAARLAEVESDANHVLKLIETMPKQGAETDAQSPTRASKHLQRMPIFLWGWPV